MCLRQRYWINKCGIRYKEPPKTINVPFIIKYFIHRDAKGRIVKNVFPHLTK